jgi:hypothetical protein
LTQIPTAQSIPRVQRADAPFLYPVPAGPDLPLLPAPLVQRMKQRLIRWVAENATQHHLIEARRFYTDAPDHAPCWLIWYADRIEMGRQGFARTHPVAQHVSLPEFHAIIQIGRAHV